MIKTLGEAVATTVGSGDPADVDRAAQSDPDRLWVQFGQNYDLWRRKPPPKKRLGEYVPGWLLEIGTLGMPSNHDLYFVVRAILYAHRVALVDWFAYYLDDDRAGVIVENDPARDREFRRAEMPYDGVDHLKKALLLWNLEKEGILFYVPPPVFSHKTDVRPFPKMSDSALTTYFSDYMDKRGEFFHPNWDNEHDAYLARRVAEQELSIASMELDKALSWFDEWGQCLDIYTSGYPLHRDGIQFLLRASGHDLLVGRASADDEVLGALWNFPSFSPDAWKELTIRDLTRLRDDAVFHKWRETLQSATRAMQTREVVNVGGPDFQDYLSVMRSSEANLLAGISRGRAARRLLGGSRDFGISIALGGAAGAGAAAAFPGQSLLAGGVAGGASVLAERLPGIARAAGDSRKAPERRDSVERHFALFGS